jgi:hypothetical protein
MIDSVRRLFNRLGFENVSVAQIMAGAGLTRGGIVARAVVDRKVADELREACMVVALGLGGWSKGSRFDREKPERCRTRFSSRPRA